MNRKCLTRKIPIEKQKKKKECESLVSVKENIDKKRKKEERKIKNPDRIQNKLNALHVIYNVKILPQ